jgi:hypothetical protein
MFIIIKLRVANYKRRKYRISQDLRTSRIQIKNYYISLKWALTIWVLGLAQIKVHSMEIKTFKNLKAIVIHNNQIVKCQKMILSQSIWKVLIKTEKILRYHKTQTDISRDKHLADPRMEAWFPNTIISCVLLLISRTLRTQFYLKEEVIVEIIKIS